MQVRCRDARKQKIAAWPACVRVRTVTMRRPSAHQFAATPLTRTLLEPLRSAYCPRAASWTCPHWPWGDAYQLPNRYFGSLNVELYSAAMDSSLEARAATSWLPSACSANRSQPLGHNRKGPHRMVFAVSLSSLLDLLANRADHLHSAARGSTPLTRRETWPSHSAI